MENVVNTSTDTVQPSLHCTELGSEDVTSGATCLQDISTNGMEPPILNSDNVLAVDSSMEALASNSQNMLQVSNLDLPSANGKSNVDDNSQTMTGPCDSLQDITSDHIDCVKPEVASSPLLESLQEGTKCSQEVSNTGHDCEAVSNEDITQQT